MTVQCVGCGRFCRDPHMQQHFDMNLHGNLTEVYFGDCEHCRRASTEERGE